MPNKAIFLDRDNTLIEDFGYINNPDQVKLLDGVSQALIELKAMDYKLVVVSNQSGVARGFFTEKVLGEIHDRLKQLLAEKGAFLDQIYYCPHHPEGSIAKYRKESHWRKPNHGMLLAAANEMDIDLSRSWMIGNDDRDIQAGSRAGCKTILLDDPLRDKHSEPPLVKPDYKAINIKEAVNIIKKELRSHSQSAAKTQAPQVAEPLPESQTTEEPQEPQAPPVDKETLDQDTLNQDTLDQNAANQDTPADDKTQLLLNSILDQLKRMNRDDLFDEFSIMRFMAGFWQIIVWVCLLISVCFLMYPTRQDNSAFMAMAFAVVFQLMSLTFYLMQGRK